MTKTTDKIEFKYGVYAARVNPDFEPLMFKPAGKREMFYVIEDLRTREPVSFKTLRSSIKRGAIIDKYANISFSPKNFRKACMVWETPSGPFSTIS